MEVLLQIIQVIGIVCGWELGKFITLVLMGEWKDGSR